MSAVWLAGLVLFFWLLAIVLLRVDRNDSWQDAHIAQLVLNRHGELDIAAVAFWIGMGVSVLSVVYALFWPVPEGFVALFGIFTGQVTAPLIFKVIFKGKASDLPARPAEPS